MKVFILLSVVAIVRAGVLPAQPVAVAGAPARIVETGASRVQRTQDNLGNYAFGYDEVHSTGGSFRREQTSPNGGVTGSYGLRDADGRLRTVNYIADEAGFRVAISTNEPGTESKNTAGALFNEGEVPPGPVIDETVHLAPAGPAVVHGPARLAVAPAAPVPVAAPAPVAVAAHAPVAAPLTHWSQQFLHDNHVAGPLVAPAPAPVNGPFFQGPPSAPVLATPAGATPTVLSNPLLDGPFNNFARPAFSTPGALTTGPVAQPLNRFAPVPLAAPAVAAPTQIANHGHFFAPQAPVAVAPPRPAPQPLPHGHFFAQRAPIAAPAAPVFAQPAAYAAPIHSAPLAGMSYATTINHAFAPRLASAPY